MIRRNGGSPTADDEVIPGVKWGSPAEPLTPAYWAALGRAAHSDDSFFNPDGSLVGEVVFCLLGGYGIKAEINLAAFRRLADNGIPGTGGTRAIEEVEALLRAPLIVNGRTVRYRFPRQRAERVAAALALLDAGAVPKEPLALRRWLLQIPGIGPKTASWIIRNHLGCDEVAILDVHVVRACQAMNVFGPRIRLPRDYEILERRFLDFCAAIGVRASILDAVIWRRMRTIAQY
jgi:N-glycosylase/DNA lyase